MPQPKTRPDSPVPSLQGPCDRSLISEVPCGSCLNWRCRLLGAPNLSKQERCKILDDSFQGKLAPYTLNFLKILTEKGYIRYFSDCCDAYMTRYYEDNGILPVTAFTAVPMTEEQTRKLREKLAAGTGKKILLHSRVEPGTLGGVRLEYDGRQLDDTVANRLQSIRDLLKKTVL